MSRIKWFDAIRALGLFLVLGYHLFYGSFPGGFLGVDIFFTFSGFLITALIIEEVRNKDSFNILSFYKRRFIRIFPPLFFSVAFTLPFLLFISPDFSVGVGRQAAAALGFVTNWFEISTGGSYEGQLIPHLYVHTWSLAMEMSYYIAWGFLCALMAALTRGLSKKNAEKRFPSFRVSIFVVSLVLAAGSYIYMRMHYSAGSDMSFIYFNTFTRFFPFFIGSSAAALWGIQHEPEKNMDSHNLRIITSALIMFAVLAGSIIVIFAVNLSFTDDFIYRYGFLFTSLLTVALIYGTHSLHILTPKVKQPAALKVTADLSYNIYLFHWPLYIIFSALIMNNLLASSVTVLVSVIMSALMFYRAEHIFKPVKDLRFAKRRQNNLVVTSAAVVIAVMAGGTAISQAPAITSIENDFAVSYIYQDVEGVKSLKREVDAINDAPVAYAGGESSLSQNILPDSAVIPAPPSTPGTESAPETPATQPAPDSTPDPTPGDTQQPAPDSTPGDTPQPTQQPAPSTTPQPTQQPTPSTTPQPTQQPPVPTSEPAPTPGRDPLSITGGVTIIGDSVALGAATALSSAIPDCFIDAKVSRQINAGHDVFKDLQRRGELREYVVIALGTNGHNNYKNLLTKFIEDLEPGHKLVFVTPFDGRSNENSKLTSATAAWLRELPGQYSFITIADWSDLISAQVNLLAGDKVHMGGQKSMTLYAECVVDALSASSNKPAKQ